MGFLFSAQGRITRGQFWMATLLYIILAAAIGVAFYMMWQNAPGTISADGEFKVEGAAALPYIVLGLGYMVFVTWSGICISAKRFHDRDKSGWWILIQMVPLIGAIWFFIETGFLRGTPGPNRFGPDPLGTV